MQQHFFALEQAIDRQPLTVDPETPLTEVIGLMQEWGNSCSTIDSDRTVRSNSSCVLIVKNDRLEGIFTERDLVKLIATETDFHQVEIRQVMTDKVVSLTATASQDIFAALNLLREHRIRHLPIVDDRHRLLGLITAKDLRQKLQPINLMQWRRVSEVMSTRVFHARPQDSVRQIAKLMAEHDISCVVIAESISDLANNTLVRPVGIITERDLVQFQNLNLDFNQPAEKLMSTPLFLISPETTLWSVQQQMQQRRVRRLLVGGTQGELLGIVTQTSLLQMFDPAEMYGVIEVLQQQVCQLEVEKTRFLENRQAELEEEVKKRTAALEYGNRRLQLEANLRQESERRFNSILDALDDVVWSVAPDSFKVIYINSAVEKIYGRSRSEFYDNSSLWLEVVHPEDRDRVANFMRHVLESGTSEIEYRIICPQGKIRWLYDRARTVYDANGTLIRLDGIATDISDRQRRENILKDIASGVSVEVGENFFSSLVRYLSKTLQVNYAFISKIIESQPNRLETVAVYGNGQIVDNFEYELGNTPCADAINRGLCIYPTAVSKLFPQNLSLETMAAESYAGMPIIDARGEVLGLIAIVDSKPFADIALIEEVLKIFANRATAELERQQVELILKQSEQKFRAIFDQTFQFIGLLEPNGNVIEANQTALDFVGLTSADVVGKPFWETPWWSTPTAQRLLKQGIERSAQGEFVRFEVEHPGSDNRSVTVDFSLTPIVDETGRVVMLIPEGRNISDRKQVEANLAKSNQILQAISSIQTQFLADTEPGVLFDGMLELLLELTESEYGFIGEVLIAADGSPIMEESYMKFRGRPYLKTHAITNIAWNEETRAFYAENAPRGMEFHNLQTLFGAVMVTGEPVIANSPHDDPRRGGLPDGHPPLNAFLGVPFYKNGKMTGMVGIANRAGGYDEALIHYLQPFLDTCSRIIEAYKSDRQRHLVEQKNQEQAALLDVATDAIMVRGLDNQILFWNRGAEKLYGWSKAEVLNKNADELFNRESATNLSEIQQAVAESGQWEGELHHVTKAGKSIVVQSRWTLVRDDEGNPQSYLVVKTDITDKKLLEAQFLRTQRLESLGTLAGGIAHDLNNILAPILGFSRLLPLKLPDVDEQTKGFFQIMETNARRGTALVKQILTFSRGLEGDRGIVQVRHLIAEIGQIVNETFPKTIELTIDVPKNLWTVNADVNQLHQVLMNLAVNARDAMPDGGKLTIAAENYTVNAEYARLHLAANVGSYVLITVTDTGAGIAPEIVDRIFEPFFTTKEIGRGTGLGLSTALGIIKSHEGFMEVVSNPSRRGTQFQVFLPACETPDNTTEESEAIPQGNGELILVVDDETAILEVTKATLETYNYQVLTAKNGIEAIALYVEHRAMPTASFAIDLVIMDIMMPNMDGRTAILTLKQIDPEVKIMAVSGLISSKEIINDISGNVTAFLAKPYTNEELLIKLHEIVGK